MPLKNRSCCPCCPGEVKRENKKKKIFWAKVTSRCRVSPAPAAAPASSWGPPPPHRVGRRCLSSHGHEYLTHVSLRSPAAGRQRSPLSHSTKELLYTGSVPNLPFVLSKTLTSGTWNYGAYCRKKYRVKRRDPCTEFQWVNEREKEPVSMCPCHVWLGAEQISQAGTSLPPGFSSWFLLLSLLFATSCCSNCCYCIPLCLSSHHTAPVPSLLGDCW